ncbi:MarR family transcriptional regulator [Methanobrevibacter sp.]|uniref:MarR family transcriptional regulator n=1 Tax=Methanobrevibacter sp. TaxID=66852 RepID=UPI0038700841
MKEEFDHQDFIASLSYVKRSKNRIGVVKCLGTTIKIPSDIANEMNLRVNQISAVLSDLKKEEICICLNESDKVGRLYQLTPKGLEVYKFLKDI